jgi:hypothetical protein
MGFGAPSPPQLPANNSVHYSRSRRDPVRLRTALYGPAEVWFLPAALGAYTIAPQSSTTLLRTYVPDLQVFDQQLAAEKVPQATRSRLIHI